MRISNIIGRTFGAAAFAAFLMFVHLPCAAGDTFVDPLSAPALEIQHPAQAPLLGIASFGQTTIAVGMRGLAVFRTAGQGQWRQSKVPVESDIVSVVLVSANDAWACGHDGVVLHSMDAGKSWMVQLDGVSAKTEFEAYYNSLIASGNGALSVPLQQVHVNYDNGPTLPWLGIWFSDAQTGYIVGSFGDIAHTEDGGKTWQPWLDHIDNPNFYDLNAVAEVGGQIYIAGEQGIVYRLDAAHEKFVALSTGYGGSLFGLTGTVKTLIAFGMEGMIYHSEDRGQTWERSNNTSTAGIMDGVVLADGRIALVSENGGILISDDDGTNFHSAGSEPGMPLAGITETGDGKMTLVGLGGVSDVSEK
jgi:photosystem II stability/assembly factor-like uncharacterized protein